MSIKKKCIRHPLHDQHLQMSVERVSRSRQQGLFRIALICDRCKAEWKAASLAQRRNHLSAPVIVPPIPWPHFDDVLVAD